MAATQKKTKIFWTVEQREQVAKTAAHLLAKKGLGIKKVVSVLKEAQADILPKHLVKDLPSKAYDKALWEMIEKFYKTPHKAIIEPTKTVEEALAAHVEKQKVAMSIDDISTEELFSALITRVTVSQTQQLEYLQKLHASLTGMKADMEAGFELVHERINSLAITAAPRNAPTGMEQKMIKTRKVLIVGLHPAEETRVRQSLNGVDIVFEETLIKAESRNLEGFEKILIRKSMGGKSALYKVPNAKVYEGVSSLLREI